MFKETNSLVQIGWRPFYSQQLTRKDFYEGFPARVASNASITVGDCVLVRSEASRVVRMLDRQSVIARVAAGSEPGVLSIVANVGELL
jgi:ribosome biogenesis GTPase / thiamine phosphate phosphatase